MYLDFLKSKIQVAPETGFEVSPGHVNPTLKPHQRDAVIWACLGGRRALFESFGLGKTVQELERCRLTAAHEDGYDEKGVPNQLKARVMESGSSKIKKRPFVRPAVNAARKAALQAMQRVIDEEIEKTMKG